MKPGNIPYEEVRDSLSVDPREEETPSESFQMHQITQIPPEICQINLTLYGKLFKLSLTDIVLLEEGLRFESRILADRTINQLDITLEKLASYRITIATAIEQLQEQIYELEEIIHDLYSNVRQEAEEFLIERKALDDRLTKSQTKTSNTEIDSLIYSDLFKHKTTQLRQKKKQINKLIAEKTKLEKIDIILNSRSKEIISILERRTIKQR